MTRTHYGGNAAEGSRHTVLAPCWHQEHCQLSQCMDLETGLQCWGAPCLQRAGLRCISMAWTGHSLCLLIQGHKQTGLWFFIMLTELRYTQYYFLNQWMNIKQYTYCSPFLSLFFPLSHSLPLPLLSRDLIQTKYENFKRFGYIAYLKSLPVHSDSLIS